MKPKWWELLIAGIIIAALAGCATNEKQPVVDRTLQFQRDKEPPIDFNHYAGEPEDVYHLFDQPHTTTKP